MSKIIITTEDLNTEVVYVPELNSDTAKELYNTALNGAYISLIEVLSNLLPVLRPAVEMERDNHVYIFREGEEGELENKLYQQRKSVYTALVSIFNTVLRTVFPDVEYIESCAQYQQHLSFEGAEADVKAFNENAAEVAVYVREHFSDIIKEVLDEGQEIETKEKEEASNEV